MDDDMTPFNIEIEPRIQDAVQDLISHLVNSLSLQGMTISDMTIQDAEEVGIEVFKAHVAHGVLVEEDLRNYSLCYRQALLMSAGEMKQFTTDWQ